MPHLAIFTTKLPPLPHIPQTKWADTIGKRNKNCPLFQENKIKRKQSKTLSPHRMEYKRDVWLCMSFFQSLSFFVLSLFTLKCCHARNINLFHLSVPYLHYEIYTLIGGQLMKKKNRNWKKLFFGKIFWAIWWRVIFCFGLFYDFLVIHQNYQPNKKIRRTVFVSFFWVAWPDKEKIEAQNDFVKMWKVTFGKKFFFWDFDWGLGCKFGTYFVKAEKEDHIWFCFHFCIDRKLIWTKESVK